MHKSIVSEQLYVNERRIDECEPMGRKPDEGGAAVEDIRRLSSSSHERRINKATDMSKVCVVCGWDE